VYGGIDVYCYICWLKHGNSLIHKSKKKKENLIKKSYGSHVGLF